MARIVVEEGEFFPVFQVLTGAVAAPEAAIEIPEELSAFYWAARSNMDIAEDRLLAWIIANAPEKAQEMIPHTARAFENKQRARGWRPSEL